LIFPALVLHCYPAHRGGRRSGLVWFGAGLGTVTGESIMGIPPQREEQAAPKEASFGQTLYRFLFFDWLFRDVNAARDLYERHAVRQHNQRMSRYLPLYMRRWSVLAACDFTLGVLFERVMQATVLSAWFFTWSCVTVTGIVIITVMWLFLASARMP
jgi:hypothetical protein